MVDDYGMDDDATCEVCGGKMEIVRPSKYQCPACESLDALRVSIRDALFAAIDAALARDGHHKSYEGTIDVIVNMTPHAVMVTGYPNRWSDEAPATSIHSTDDYRELFGDEPPKYWALELHCYVLGNHRLYCYSGRTERECWEHLAHDIPLWREEIDSGYEKCYDDAAFKYRWGGVRLMAIEIGPADDEMDAPAG